MHSPRTTLARGPIAHVERGPDGHLHLHVGPVSVRLNPSAAASLSRTLAEAVEVLELDLSTRAADGCAAQRRSFRSQS